MAISQSEHDKFPWGRINCLMYADDLLILSETENGLTESLERLSNYAKKCKLKISAKKTKIIVFNKAGKIINVKLRMDDILIQSCSEYTYLGTIFTPGNSFKKLKQNCIRRLVVLFLLFKCNQCSSRCTGTNC